MDAAAGVSEPLVATLPRALKPRHSYSAPSSSCPLALPPLSVFAVHDSPRNYSTQLSHKQMTGVLSQYGEKQEEKRSVDNQAGTQFAESNLLKIGRKSV